jgi:ATP-binding cassette, subfamily B, bacterial MsbA
MAGPDPSPRPKGHGRVVLAWVWRTYVRHRLPLLGLALVLMSVEGSMLGALSYLMRPMFDQAFVMGDAASVYWIAGSVAAVFTLRALAAFSHRVLMSVLGERVIADVQSDLLAILGFSRPIHRGS